MKIDVDKITSKSFIAALKRDRERKQAIRTYFTCKLALVRRKKELEFLLGRGWRADGVEQSIDHLQKALERHRKAYFGLHH